MKIVNIIQRYPPAIGGAETWCQQVCRYMAGKGHQVRVLTMDVDTEEQFWRYPLDNERKIALGSLAIDKGVFIRRYRISLPIHTFHHLIYGALLNRLMKIYFFGPHSGEMYGRMWREIKSADLIFLHTLPYPHNFIAILIAKLFKKKIVFVPHFHPTHPHYERASNYWLLRHSDAVITVSPFEKKYLQDKGVSKGKLYVTGNAIDTENYTPSNLDDFQSFIERKYSIKSEEKLILFIGRKTPEKGVDHLIAAVNKLASEMPVKLVLMGPAQQWYAQIYASLSDAERKWIIDVGIVDHQEKVNFLHIADLLVLPSKYEAFGIVLLEAWACGIPVIGSYEGAMPSVIEKDGWLCRFGDIEDLTSKIRLSLGNPEKSKEKGLQGKAKVFKKYTWKVIGKKVAEVAKTAYGGYKVLICTNAYPPRFVGGAELIAHEQAKVLKNKGYDVLVLTGMVDHRGNRYDVQDDLFERIPVKRVCLQARNYSGEYVNFFQKEVNELFGRIIDDFSPDIIHYHNIVGLSAGLPAIAQRRKIKTIMTLHDYWAICFKNTLMTVDGSMCDDFEACQKCHTVIDSKRWPNLPSKMRRDYIALQLRTIDTVVSPSEYLAGIYERAALFGDKIKVIPNGVDVYRFQKIERTPDPKKVRFSYIGHLGQHKGIKNILEAIKYIEAKDRIKLNLVGEGEIKEELKEIVKKEGLKKLVKFWGKVNNTLIEKVYAKTDVLILPSIWPENHPVTITEAMACGIPVIASRIGGIPELVEDKMTGYLYQKGNSKELAQKMSYLIANPTKIKVLGENGLKKIQNYTFDKQVERLMEIYNQLHHDTVNHVHGQNLIACIGRKISPECVYVVNTFNILSDLDLKFVMSDWLDEIDIRSAKLLWVLDQNLEKEDVMIGLRNKIPLLVPEGHKKLKELCVALNCGLSCGNEPAEIRGALERLVRNEALNRKMGKNGFKAFWNWNRLIKPLFN